MNSFCTYFYYDQITFVQTIFNLIVWSFYLLVHLLSLDLCMFYIGLCSLLTSGLNHLVSICSSFILLFFILLFRLCQCVASLIVYIFTLFLLQNANEISFYVLIFQSSLHLFSVICYHEKFHKSFSTISQVSVYVYHVIKFLINTFYLIH